MMVFLQAQKLSRTEVSIFESPSPTKHVISRNCKYIQAHIEIDNRDMVFTIPRNQSDLFYIEESLVGGTGLQSLASIFLVRHGFDSKDLALQKRLIARALECYTQARACHDNGQEALEVRLGGRKYSMPTFNIRVSESCVVGVQYPTDGNATAVALDFVMKQGWDSGEDCRDAMCIANRLVCKMHSQTKIVEKEKVSKVRAENHRASAEPDPVECEGNICRTKKICWTGFEWVRTRPSIEGHLDRLENWWKTELLTHPGRGGAALDTYEFVRLAGGGNISADNVEALVWRTPLFVKFDADIVFQTHIPHVAENIFDAIAHRGVNYSFALALPGLEQESSPWVDNFVKALEAEGMLSKVYYKSDFKRPICFSNVNFRAAAKCVGPDVARERGCTSSWFDSSSSSESASNIIFAVQKAVWKYVGIHLEYSKEIRIASVTNNCQYPVTIIMRACNRVFLDLDKIRNTLEKTLSSKFNSNLPVTCVRIVDFQDIPFHEQVKLMAHSAVVIAAHGAALINIAWMRPNSTLIELFPFNFEYHTYFGSLARRVNVHYVALMDPFPRSPCMLHRALDWTEQDLTKRIHSWPKSTSEDIQRCMSDESCQRCAKDSSIVLSDIESSILQHSFEGVAALIAFDSSNNIPHK